MKIRFFEIGGSITYDAAGGYATLEFGRISELTAMKNPDIYYVYAGGKNLYDTCYALDANNEDTGIVLAGRRYFGKDLHGLCIELRNLATETALESLEGP